jgi:mxaA protein
VIAVRRSASLFALGILAAIAFVAGGSIAVAQSSANVPVPVPAMAAAVVQQPRAFGYVVGDIVTQRVLLEADGRRFEPKELPRTERLGVWLERRPGRIERDASGREWLAVSYQIVNAPQSLTTVNLPAWELDGKVRISEWPLSVGPLTPRDAFESGGLQPLRPDRPAPIIATAPIARQLHMWSVALALTLAAWLVWWLHRNRRASANLPFARALREIRAADDTAPQAWQSLHRAFDETAGRVIQSESLAALFQRAPHLVPRREQIETFYTASRERFFGAGAAAKPISVGELCRDLRRLEKRHER